MKLIGDLLLVLIFLLALLFSFQYTKLFCKGIDALLKDISDAVNGRYKSKYKRR